MKKFISLILCIIAISAMLCSCSSNSKNEHKAVKCTYDSAYTYYDSSAISAYETVCEAVLNGETEARINSGLLEEVNQLIYTSFPLYPLISSITAGDNGVNIVYTQDTEAHLQSVYAFEDKIAEIQEQCKEGEVGTTEYIINVYNYVSYAFCESSNSGLTCYDAIMQNEGNAYTYSNMFEYILRQSDIPAYHIIASGDNGGWGLSAAEINGTLYYFDVGHESRINGGTQLVYFGMTSEDVINYGYSTLTYTDQTEAEYADDLAFDVCRECKEWEISDDSLLVTKNDGIIVEIALN